MLLFKWKEKTTLYHISSNDNILQHSIWKNMEAMLHRSGQVSTQYTVQFSTVPNKSELNSWIWL